MSEHRKERKMTYNVLAVILVHLLNGAVDKRLALSSLDNESGFACLKSRDGEKDEFNKTQDTVLLNNLRCCDSLLDLALDKIRAIQKIDLAVGIRGRHLAASESWKGCER
jgi:hypothetical protein